MTYRTLKYWPVQVVITPIFRLDDALDAIVLLFNLIKMLLLPLVDILFKTLSTLPDIGRLDPFYI